MSIFVSGLDVLVAHAWTVFSLLLAVLWGLIVFTALFSRIFKTRFSIAEYISLGMAGWILPAALLSVLFFVGIARFGEIAAAVLSAFALLAVFYILFKWKKKHVSLPILFLCGGLLTVSLLLQLAFLKGMILPSYFDSAEHYRIIKYFAGYGGLSNRSIPLINYYHVGFHFFAAALSNIFHLGIVDTLLVFGQVILAILPFSLFFIIKPITESNTAAVFTCLLAGFGWHMPSHVMNWGKYPALFSLVGIHFMLTLGYLLYKNNHIKRERYLLYFCLGLGVLISALIHTRSLIIFIMMAISLFLMNWHERLHLLYQHITFALVLFILVGLFFIVQTNGVLAVLFHSYLSQDIFATGLTVFLFIFATRAFPNLAFFLLTMILMMMSSLFVPVNGALGYGALTLLDRPYVQMLLYLPLSISGGLGLAGLIQFLQRFSSQSKFLTRLAAFLLFGFVVFNAGAKHKFYSSDCCQIASHDDLAAIHWMDKMLLPDAAVLIASTELLVTSFESSETLAGVDGGTWITSLTSRKTIPARGTLNFDQPETHTGICQKNIEYIYAGGRPESFNSLQLDARKEWYRNVFSLPGAKVYQVVGCQ